MAALLEPEVEEILSALAYYAPSYSQTVEPFAVAHQRACAFLAERGSALSPNDIAAAVDRWPAVPSA